MTDALRHERQQGPVHQLSDCVTTSRAMACANGRGIWLLGNSGFNTLQNARIGILYSAYFARPNAQVNRQKCEAFLSALNLQLGFGYILG
jgi:hypothetical protein